VNSLKNRLATSNVLSRPCVQILVVANQLLSIQTNSPIFTCIHTKIDTTIPDISSMNLVLKCQVKRSFLRKGPTILGQREYTSNIFFMDFVVLPNFLFLQKMLFISVLSIFTTKIDSIQRTYIKIENSALYLYANKEPTNLHNNLALLQTNTQYSPVAKLRASTTKHNGMEPGNASHYEPDCLPPRVNLCKTAKVQLTGCNPRPSWGLYLGSKGTIIDIIFAPNQSLQTTTIYPSIYLLTFLNTVDLLSILNSTPTYIPIAPITMPCKVQH
jgi:hypothetical protein